MRARSAAQIQRNDRKDWDFTDAYSGLLESYVRTRQPVEANFRELVSLHAGVDRATHLFHSYPAKLLLNIPLFFLNCNQIKKGELFDPFCGSGTTLVEGALAGYKVSGADANPLARLITESKLTYLEPRIVHEAFQGVLLAAPQIRPANFSPVVDVNRWFSTNSQNEISRLLGAIYNVTDFNVQRFLKVCLSACIRKFSFVDHRLSVPVRVKEGSRDYQKALSIDITDVFGKCVFSNIKRLDAICDVDSNLLNGLKIGLDARELPDECRGIVDLVITSPPYVGAQKYIRASSLSIGWLGMAPEHRLRALETKNIGREHYSHADYRQLLVPEFCDATSQLTRIWQRNPLRAHIAANYLVEMTTALQATVHRLRMNGAMVLVIGNNTICGELFDTRLYLDQILQSMGMSKELEVVDDIKSRGLMTKRNRTAGVITREHIVVYRRRASC